MLIITHSKTNVGSSPMCWYISSWYNWFNEPFAIWYYRIIFDSDKKSENC